MSLPISSTQTGETANSASQKKDMLLLTLVPSKLGTSEKSFFYGEVIFQSFLKFEQDVVGRIL
jgi:hypothetical protein